MKNEKLEIIESNEFQNLFDKSKKLIDSARSNMGQMANAITVLTSFLLGRYIIEQEQQGSERAKYGAKVLDSLSSYLTEEYGRGFQEAMLLECVNFIWLTTVINIIHISI